MEPPNLLGMVVEDQLVVNRRGRRLAKLRPLRLHRQFHRPGLPLGREVRPPLRRQSFGVAISPAAFGVHHQLAVGAAPGVGVGDVMQVGPPRVGFLDGLMQPAAGAVGRVALDIEPRRLEIWLQLVHIQIAVDVFPAGGRIAARVVVPVGRRGKVDFVRHDILLFGQVQAPTAMYCTVIPAGEVPAMVVNRARNLSAYCPPRQLDTYPLDEVVNVTVGVPAKATG